MRTIIVDDEPVMLRSFARYSKDIEEINLVGQFQYPEDAEAYAAANPVDIAFLDIKMPHISGIEVARQLRTYNPQILIVFVSAYNEYVQESNQENVDYFIVKPYTKKTLQNVARRMMLLADRLKKDIYIQMFGRFVVYNKGKPVPLSGKAKEILALVAVRRGKEISNEEIYSTLWEDREYSNVQMKVYYNALKRLRLTLERQGLSDLLISTPHGQIFNTGMVDCDYYAWQDKEPGENDRFEGEFLSEYSWGEIILANILTREE